MPAGLRAGAAGVRLLLACIAACVLAARPCGAQEFSLLLKGQSAGLENLAIHQMVFDRQGDLWLATDGGLYRFDGTSFTLYDQARGLPRNATQALSLSPGGRLFVRTDVGIFAGEDGHFEEIRTPQGSVHTDLVAPLLATSDQRVLFIHDQQLSALVRTGAAWQASPLFTAAQLAAHPPLRSIQGLLQDGRGALWFGCGTGLCRLRDGRLDLWGPQQGVPAGSYNSLLQDDQGRLWARSPEHLVVRDRGSAGFRLDDPPEPLIRNATQALMLALDPRRRVITRTSAGLAILDGDHWLSYGVRNGLPNHSITQAAVDQEGNFWLGVLGTGLYRWPGYGNIESWTQRSGLDLDAVWSIVRDQRHRLILATDAGCRMLDESSRRIVPCPWTGLPARGAYASALDPDGNYWVAYQTAQLWEVPAGSRRARRITSVPERFDTLSLLFDRPGQGYMGSWETGFTTLDTRTGRATFQRPPGDARVDEIARSAADGALWLATTGGLYTLRDGRFVLVPTPLGGVNLGLDTITGAPNGDIWASRVGSPILHVTDTASAHPRIEWLQAKGLGRGTVYSLRADRRGWIWANTGEGVGVYDGRTWRRFGIEDGLVWTDTEQGAFFADDDGSVWVGTSGGLTHIRDPGRWIRDTSRPIRLRIAHAGFGNADLADGADGSTAHLPWRSDTPLDVSFSVRAFERSPSTQLRYRLLGLSSQWYSTLTFDIHIPALAPGHYELEAVAVDAAHHRRSDTQRLVFDIIPPWWDTVLARALGLAVLAALLLLLWRWRQRRLRRRLAELERERREHQLLLERATRDSLTGLWNRVTVLELLSGEIETASRSGTPLAVALVDADHFKAINDTLGHAAGDEVLRQLTQRLRASFRQRDLLGRYGGEEFLVVMPGVPESDRGNLLEGVRANIADLPFAIGGLHISVTVSIGVAWMAGADEPAANLIGRADQALYEAKAAGRNRVMYNLGGDSTPASLSTTASHRNLMEQLERMRRGEDSGDDAQAPPERVRRS